MGGPRAPAAIAAARLVRERSESVPETQSRLLMVFAGVPEPVCNHPYMVEGIERYRLDLAWVEHKVALEYDGRWHDEPEQRRKDEARRAEMRAAGWVIIVIRAEHLYDEPDGVVRGGRGTAAARLSCGASPNFSAGSGPEARSPECGRQLGE